ncbi:hypothetical protein E0I26_11140 [Flavobacterium rhamnosiphilum]|uniref:Uncharacterized protein n=1 Tax=Flavobacterium rhamnosiphilum TaxID=2541724 RepID=A0A4R5F604_9FLAO|nr:hypothetical protein [Flavobacterium rhamnosiphilum]TDE43163.1 hypothetical protein E0I26_11140 [Flavobacterium rhamnosiphilum]
METKDILFIIGIMATLAVSLVNLYFTAKNRKNNLREHIYKEQIRICTLIINDFYKLNLHITELFENPEVQNDSVNKFEIIGAIIYQHEHILPNNIVTLSNETLYKSEGFFVSLREKNQAKTEEEYKEYFNNYYLLVILIRDYFGIDSLSKENQTLYKLPKYYKRIMGKF